VISLLIVDDQPLIRTAIRDLFIDHSDIEIVAEASDGTEAVELAIVNKPDVVLMDIRMPRLDGLAATAAICDNPQLTDTRVLILTTFEEDENILSALRAGASGFIGKGAEPEDIVRAVRAIHAGDTLLSPTATKTLIERYLSTPASPVGPHERMLLGTLTERELEVLQLIARGNSNEQIADNLYISPLTVKTHVNRIMTKLHAHARAQLVVFAYETGTVTPGP
jgi:DNA-binding NarL/FixJ family response regulator